MLAIFRVIVGASCARDLPSNIVGASCARDLPSNIVGASCARDLPSNIVGASCARDLLTKWKPKHLKLNSLNCGRAL